MYGYKFIDNEETDTQGFCMHNDEVVVVCFRGTESIRDWMTNLNFLQVRRVVEVSNKKTNFLFVD